MNEIHLFMREKYSIIIFIVETFSIFFLDILLGLIWTARGGKILNTSSHQEARFLFLFLATIMNLFFTEYFQLSTKQVQKRWKLSLHKINHSSQRYEYWIKFSVLEKKMKNKCLRIIKAAFAKWIMLHAFIFVFKIELGWNDG